MSHCRCLLDKGLVGANQGRILSNAPLNDEDFGSKNHSERDRLRLQKKKTYRKAGGLGRNPGTQNRTSTFGEGKMKFSQSNSPWCKAKASEDVS